MDFVIICRKALYFRGSLSICPAYAGMILILRLHREHGYDLSRVCGDDPAAGMPSGGASAFVPRMRG